MSRFSPASSAQLWQAGGGGPSSPHSARMAAAQQAQQANEEAWRRTQQMPELDDGAQYGAGAAEPVDYDIYNKAVSVSDPRVASYEGDVDPHATLRKTVVRRVEVPFVRHVQVPTQVVRLEPATVEVRVPVKRLVEAPGFQSVQEAYVEYEEREAVRDRVVWVKKVQPERYIERVPVQKVRTVQRPTSVIREVEDWQSVSVPTTKRVVVPGYTTMPVPDSKVVEVEEEQRFALRPEPTGPSEIRSTRDIGRLPNAHSHLPDAPYGSAPSSGTPLANAGLSISAGAPVFGSSQGFNRSGGMGGLGAAPGATSSRFGPGGVGSPQSNPLEALRCYGLGIDESHTAHTDGCGVLVTRVDRGGDAARAGLQPGDMVTAINARPVSSCAEFVTLLRRAPAGVTLSVNRDGRRNIALLFQPR